MFEEIIKRWKKRNPQAAQGLGFHEFDGIIADLSKETIQKNIVEIEEDIHKLENIEEPTEKILKFEYYLILSKLRVELFELKDHREYLKNPLLYIIPALSIEGSYASRSFAPRENRIASIIKIQEKLPKLLNQARENLERPLAKAKVSMSINFLQGFIGYFNDKLIEFVSKTKDDQLLDQWSEINQSCVASMQEFLEELEQTYLPESHEDFAMGEQKFLQLLEKTEGVKMDVDDLLKVGEDALKRDYQELIQIGLDNDTTIDEITVRMMEDIPDPSEVIEKTKESLERTRDFLIEKDLVTLPSTEQCLVTDMPEAMKKFAFAAMNTPGPFEKEEAKEAYYYVNIPPHDLSNKEKIQRMGFFNLAQLEVITIHEAWPGHYLQLLVNNTAKSDIAKMMARSTTMIEGWGLYTEKMIIDQGYDKLDLIKLRVAQLKASALRAARFVSAVKMHCKGMTVEESTQLFIEKAFTSESMGRIEANRGTINPMYLNYTLGKLMIYKLREDYKKEKGDEYDLKQFHDEILSYASPPIAVLREMMLDNPGTSQDFL